MLKAKKPNDDIDKIIEATVADSTTTESLFETLPGEMVKKIVSHLQSNDLTALASTSRRFHTMFSCESVVAKLLLASTQGNEDKVKRLFAISPAHIRYLTKRGDVEDYSGRQFTHISPFQYALWAMDWNMWMTMFDALQQAVKDDYPYEEAETIRETLLVQYEQVRKQGLKYVLKGEVHKPERQFDVQPLIDALNTYASIFGSVAHGCGQHDYWCHTVGQLQRLVPAHVAQHYCDAKGGPFNGSKSFNNRKFPRSLLFQNWQYLRNESWFPLSQHSRLGLDFAICTYSSRCYGRRQGVYKREVSANSAALSALYKIRAQDIVALKELLSTPLQKPDFHASHGVS